jgi:hypothetical protein
MTLGEVRRAIWQPAAAAELTAVPLDDALDTTVLILEQAPFALRAMYPVSRREIPRCVGRPALLQPRCTDRRD